MPRNRKSRSLKASNGPPTTTRYETAVEPYVNLNDKTGILSITAHSAFLRDDKGHVISEDGSYVQRYPHRNRIIRALQDVTAPTSKGTDLWLRLQAGETEALGEVSRAIKATYDHEYDGPEPPDNDKVRGCQTFIISTAEHEPSTVQYPETGLYKRPNPPLSFSNSARSGVLPSARILARPHKTQDKSKITSVSVVLDGTFATKSGEIRAMTKQAVDEFANCFADSVRLIGSELASLASSSPQPSPQMGSNYKQRHGKAKEQLEEMAGALSKQWCESILGPVDIDPERIEGSVSTYAAEPVYTEGFRGLQPIRVDVVADYSRITGRESVDEVEEDAGK